MAQVRIKVDLTPLNRVQTATGGRGGSRTGVGTAAGAAGGGGGGGASGGLRPVFHQWAKRYESDMRRRFNVYSRGGGNWKPLALSTIRARRSSNRRFRTRGEEADSLRYRLSKMKDKGAKSHQKRQRMLARIEYLESGKGVTILKDTGILFQSLTIGQFGNLLRDLPNGVRYGFADVPHRATPSVHGGAASIAKIAGFHNVGSANGRPPQRLILAQPDPQTLRGMANDLVRGIAKVAKGGVA